MHPCLAPAPTLVGADSEGPVITSCAPPHGCPPMTPPPRWMPPLATRWRPGGAWRSDGGRVCFALAGPYFEEPLQWKVTEDCQVRLTCKANPRPCLQPCPPGPVRGACGASPSRCLSLPTFLNPCAWLTPRRSSPRETTCNWKTKSHPHPPHPERAHGA